MYHARDSHSQCDLGSFSPQFSSILPFVLKFDRIRTEPMLMANAKKNTHEWYLSSSENSTTTNKKSFSLFIFPSKRFYFEFVLCLHLIIEIGDKFAMQKIGIEIHWHIALAVSFVSAIRFKSNVKKYARHKIHRLGGGEAIFHRKRIEQKTKLDEYILNEENDSNRTQTHAFKSNNKLDSSGVSCKSGC